MPKGYPPISYGDYLKTKELLSLQSLRSKEFGNIAHDEMLFIVVHQTYELWFKQILTEIESVREIFQNKSVEDTMLGLAVARLERIVEIQRLLIDQIRVLETMTPLDFLEFREVLYPASGFQSIQFRLLENRLGLKSETRLPFNALPYHSFVSPEDAAILQKSEGEQSIFDMVEKWLERTPFLETGSFKFLEAYRQAVVDMLNRDAETIQNNSMLRPEEKERNQKEIDSAQQTFAAFFSPDEYEKLRSEGQWRMSYRAIQAALLIQLYRDQPVLHLPYRLLTALQDIDESMTTWRYRHALMAHRMLGSKVGTGGSSGHRYLKAATDKHRVYADLFNLATFLIPRSQLPALPKEIREKLGFYYSSGQ
jgi:tryptophan 2,3-dioxygenase